MNRLTYQIIGSIVLMALIFGSYTNTNASSISAAATANIYYVSVNGNDSNTGASSSAPFRTIQKCMKTANSGYTCIVAAGTYAERVTIEKNGITLQADGEVATKQIYVTGSNNVVRGFTIKDKAANSGIFVTGNNNLFEDNEISNTMQDGIWFFGHDNIFRGNNVHDILDPAISGDPHVDCFQTWGSSWETYNVLFEKNFCNHTRTSGSNQIVMVENQSIYPMRNITFQNNIFIMHDAGDSLMNFHKKAGQLEISQINVLNNVFYNATMLGVVAVKFSGISGGMIANNVSIGYVNLPAKTNESVVTITNNIQSAPYGMVNYQGYDFHLTASSPLRDAGYDVDIPYDYDGVPRYQGSGYDIGAFEFVSSISPTPISTQTPIGPTATQTQIATPTTVPTGNNSVNVRVARGSDDVEESATGWMYLDSSDLELIYDTNTQKVGLRFNGVNIPKNAVILNAYIQFTVDKASANATTLTIQGLKTPNAVAFTTKSRNLSSRAKTTASVKWTPVSWLTPGVIGVEQRTPNMASIIQEIVNQSGWVSGNSFGVIISGNGKRVAKSYEGGATGAPVLHIDYTTGAALSMQLPEETATPMETPTESSVPVLPSATPTYYAFPTPTLEATIPPAPELVYDDTDGSFVYSSNWLSFDAPQAYGGSYKATAAAGASVTLDFTGQSFSVLYTDGQDYKGMSVYVDGELVETILRKTDTITYQQRWDYPGLLAYGTHTVQLVFTDGNGTLDAMIVR